MEIPWRCENDRRKINYGSWDITYKQKKLGGLGIKDVRGFNKVLLVK